MKIEFSQKQLSEAVNTLKGCGITLEQVQDVCAAAVDAVKKSAIESNMNNECILAVMMVVGSALLSTPQNVVGELVYSKSSN